MNYDILDSVVSLANTESYFKYLQNKMVSNSNRFAPKLKYLIEIEIPNIMQLFIISFKSSSGDNMIKDQLLRVIEFARLLCEGYNKYFKKYMTLVKAIRITDPEWLLSENSNKQTNSNENNDGRPREYCLTFSQLCLKFYHKLLIISKEYIVKSFSFQEDTKLKKDLNSVIEVNLAVGKFIIEITQGNFEENVKFIYKKDYFLPISMEINQLVNIMFDDLNIINNKEKIEPGVELIYGYFEIVNSILEEFQTFSYPGNILDVILSVTDMTHINYYCYMTLCMKSEMVVAAKENNWINYLLPNDKLSYFSKENLGEVIHGDLVKAYNYYKYDKYFDDSNPTVNPEMKGYTSENYYQFLKQVNFIQVMMDKVIYLKVVDMLHFKLGCLTYQIILTLYKLTKEESNWKYYNNFKLISELIYKYEFYKIIQKDAPTYWQNYVKSVEVTLENDIHDESEGAEYAEYFQGIENIYSDNNNNNSSASSSNNNMKLMFVGFTVHPDMIFFNEYKCRNWILENTGEDYTENLKTLVNYSKTIFTKDIKTKKSMLEVKEVNYEKQFEVYDNTDRNELYSFIISVMCNFILILFMSQQQQIDPLTETVVYEPYMNIYLWILFWIGNLIHISWNSYCIYYYYFVVTHLKYEKFENDSIFVNIKDVLIHFMTAEKTRMLFLNIIISVVALFGYAYLIPFQLFLCYKFSSTLKMLIFAINLKFIDFASALVLMLMIVLFYSSLSIYLFSNDIVTATGIKVCQNYFTCFFYLNSNGLRTASGFDFPIKTMNTKGYWKELISDWTFFFLLVLVMANIINAIIVDLFQKLSEDKEKKETLSQQQCMICSIQEDDFKMRKMDYHNHLNEIHNSCFYLQYFYTLNNQSNENLSKSSYNIKRMLENDKIMFFPNNQTFGYE